MRRTMLFLPGASPGNILNADAFGADSIIIDLEDAVAHSEKDTARILTRNALSALHFNAEVIVRINSLTTPFWQEDLDAVIPQKPDVIMPTKIYTAEDIRTISDYIGKIEKRCGIEEGTVKLIPLLETAGAIEHAFEIATASPRMAGLYLGAEDLALDMKAVRTAEGYEIEYSRSRLVIAARAAGIDALDTPYIRNIHDNEALTRETIKVKNMGFNGKACIYPGQVETINDIFAPTREEYENALELLAAVEKAKEQGKGVITFRGKLVDGPVIIMAQVTVEEYEKIYGV